MRGVVIAGLLIGSFFVGTSSVDAQPLGVFRWQLASFCNIVTLQITQHLTATGPIFALNGFDDLCGAAARAPVVGTAVFNHDGTVGVGLTIVITPGGAPVHVDARVQLASIGGPWVDSMGNSGTFVFTPGAGTGGSPRPVSANGIAPGSITAEQLAPGTITSAQLALGAVTSAQLAPGSVTATHLAPGAIGAPQIEPGTIGGTQINTTQVQVRIAGSCPLGKYLRGVNADGSVVCEFVEPHVTTVADDPAGTVGDDSAIAFGTDGLPVISHLAAGGGGLRVTHCGNADCTAGNVSTTADDPANIVGQFTSIAIGTDGFPIISHHDATAFGLRVTHCSTVDCSNADFAATIDAVGGSMVGTDTSIAIGSDGLPVISHRDSAAGGIRVTHCGDVRCTAGNVSTTIDDAPAMDDAYGTSIAIGTDGLPIISHFEFATNIIRVTHCGNVTCTAGNSSVTVDTPVVPQVGGPTSMAIGADGFPIIAHFDAAANALRLTHCGNALCTAGNVSTTVDDQAVLTGEEPSIAIGVDGLAVIAHRADGKVLRITRCGNIACTAGNVSFTVDAAVGQVGAYPAIAIPPDGRPIISHGTSQGELRVTKCARSNCQ